MLTYCPESQVVTVFAKDHSGMSTPVYKKKMTPEDLKNYEKSFTVFKKDIEKVVETAQAAHHPKVTLEDVDYTFFRGKAGPKRYLAFITPIIERALRELGMDNLNVGYHINTEKHFGDNVLSIVFWVE